MKPTLSAFIVAAVCAIAAASAPTTRPSDADPNVGALEIRATETFNRGEYAAALPMLKKVRGSVADQPEKVGPINERIRVCEKNLADPQAATTDPPADATLDPAVKQDPPPTAEQRKAHAAPKPGEVLELGIKELGNFQYDAERGGPVPADVQRLTGATVRLTGFMVPIDQAENISQFALVPSLFNCCFGQPPQVQHTVIVNCPKGKAVSYFPDEISVEGKLTVEVKKDDDYVVSLFEVEAASVKPAPK